MVVECWYINVEECMKGNGYKIRKEAMELRNFQIVACTRVSM